MYDKLNNYIGEFLTYKQLCEILELKYYAGGKSKQLQIGDIQRYYELEKIKTKYRIIMKRESVIPKVDRRSETSANNSVKYGNDIETIILYTLQNKEEFVCTISQALLLCKLINENYSVGRRDIPITSKVLDLDEKNVYHFYDTTSRRLKDTFKRALDRMKGKSLISYTELKMVAYNEVKIAKNELGDPKLNKKGKISYTTKEIHRYITDEEDKIIMECEAKALEDVGCIDKQQVFLSHKWNEFRDKVSENISERLNIKYYYEVFRIVTNSKYIDKAIKRREAISSEEVLNYTIMESLTESMNKASRNLDENGNRKYDDKFISDNLKMIEVTINNNSTYELFDYIKKFKEDSKNNKADKIIKPKLNNNNMDEGIPF